MSQMPVRILLVEDDQDDFIFTGQLLRESDPEGYDLEWTSDYEGALKKLAQGGYDVCLVEYQLGNKTGIDFINEAITRGIGAPIILLTSESDKKIDVAAMNAGAADYLSKDQLSPSLLERAIRYSIQQKKGEQQRIRLLMEQAARAEAEAANRSKDAFLAVLSHELRTPLTAVLLNVSALEQESQLDEKMQELVNVIKRNVDLEARLIDDLLDLTRIARGKLEIRREVVDVHEQIDYAVRVCCGSDIERKGLLVQVRAQAQRHNVWGDPARLQQVLWNLLKNAVKFTPPGGKIEIVTSNDDNDQLIIEVRDSGIGIRPDALPRIFNAFEQVDRTITRRFGGLGLGLAICKAITHLHGGKIRAESDGPDTGARFIIELPLTLKMPQTDLPPVEGPEEHARRSNISILLVEDHADTAAAMKRLLCRRGYKVQMAHTMSDALKLATSFSFDVLISDIGLPDGSGLELMQQLQGKRPVRGIALTGFGMEEDIERSLAAGFTEHLTKPISLQQLQAAIDRVTSAPQSQPIAAST